MSDPSADRIAFIGLGTMGSRMSRRLVDAGLEVIGYDPAPAARAELTAAGGRAVSSAAEAVTGAGAVILMLPNSRIVESVLADDALLNAAKPGVTVIDMSSSEPESTRALAANLAARSITLIDAPVSGGIRGAEDGTLTIMAGGPEHTIAEVRPVIAPLGTLRHVGASGAGHAVKAINNLLAATNLLAAAEGVAAGRRFGVDPGVIIDTINTASGRSAATQLKFTQHILPGTYDSGFALALMLKDMRIATALARSVGAPATLGEGAVELWSRAAADLAGDADQTEIARWLDTPKS